MDIRTQSTPRGDPRGEGAFTLTELMVVVVIVALLALIAIPTLSRDNAKSNFSRLTNELHQTLQRAKMEAISSKEPRQVAFSSTTNYELQAYLPGTATVAQLKAVTVPPQTEITSYKLAASADCDAGTTAGVPATISFRAVSDVLVNGAASSVTLCVQTKDTKLRGRVSVTGATGFVNIMEGW